MPTTLTPGSPLPPPSPTPEATVPVGPRTPPRRAPWLIAGGVFAAIAIGWGTLNVIALIARGEETATTSWPTAEIRSLEVDTDGSVTVRPSSDGEVRVEQRREWSLRQPDHTQELTADGVLRLEGDCSSFGFAWCEVAYVVELPADVPVVVRTSGGSIRMGAMSAAADLDTSAGSVRVDGASGPLRLHSSAGPVRADGLTSDVVDASSSAGSVRLAFDAAPRTVTARSSAGGVTVQVPADGTAYRVNADSDAGGTDVEVPTDPAADRVIDARSSAGGVDVIAR